MATDNNVNRRVGEALRKTAPKGTRSGKHALNRKIMCQLRPCPLWAIHGGQTLQLQELKGNENNVGTSAERQK